MDKVVDRFFFCEEISAEFYKKMYPITIAYWPFNLTICVPLIKKKNPESSPQHCY